MPRHSATLIQAVRGEERWEARAWLACGCEVALSVPLDRVVDTAGGERILVGKSRCPKAHPVKRPR